MGKLRSSILIPYAEAGLCRTKIGDAAGHGESAI